MKKLVALLLAAIMLVACTAALADAPVVPSSAKTFDAPDFVNPVSMKTKKVGTTMTVTFGGDVDAAIVKWLGAFEEDEGLVIANGVATYSLAGHKYQPGVSAKARDNTYEVSSNDNNIVQDTTVTIGEVDYTVQVEAAEAGSKTEKWLKQHTDPADVNYFVISYEDKDGNTLYVTNADLARKIIDAARGDEVITLEQEWDPTPYNDNDQTKRDRSWYASRIQVRDPKGNIIKFGWKVIQTYGTWVDGAAYVVTKGNTVTTYDRAGRWITTTIAVEDTDTFLTGNAGTTYYTWTRCTNTKEGKWLSSVREEYTDADIAAVQADYLNNANVTLVRYIVEEAE